MEEKQSNGMAIASLVLGIVALVLVFFLPWVALIGAIIGLVLSVLARKNNPSGMATAGLVLNIIALILSCIVFISCVACAGAIGGLGTAIETTLN